MFASARCVCVCLDITLDMQFLQHSFVNFASFDRLILMSVYTAISGATANKLVLLTHSLILCSAPCKKPRSMH